jgi:hypothetical protein
MRFSMERVACLDLRFAWPLGVGLVGLATILPLAWLEVCLRGGGYFWMLLGAPPLLQTIFWISTRPDPRYFSSTPWLFLPAPVLGLIARRSDPLPWRRRSPISICRSVDGGPAGEDAMGLGGLDEKFPEIPRLCA